MVRLIQFSYPIRIYVWSLDVRRIIIHNMLFLIELWKNVHCIKLGEFALIKLLHNCTSYSENIKCVWFDLIDLLCLKGANQSRPSLKFLSSKGASTVATLIKFLNSKDVNPFANAAYSYLGRASRAPQAPGSARFQSGASLHPRLIAFTQTYATVRLGAP